ncbi:PEP-CTERM sorting domain-containing protein [Pseudoduganella chitinolytica]|uniref:PEP-CTERM sorting domain-containing protein n=1 Tax=Pseudoduganella chitinolytica TaxID=34070 RepID=A0ABY8BLP1_9BURK|nr:PEP-CTERM sorting domain-containing protein [Pseudoduganella chitinolytica]WEF35811.1 PEP-CTERM sorting domain-containing protein [Pseudoduganella chitinolytica]
MKSLFASLSLAMACVTAHGAEPVPVLELPGLTREWDAPAVDPVGVAVSTPAQPVPEPGVLPMLAVGAVLVALRLGRKRRNDTFK